MFSVPQYTSTELQQYNFFVMQDPVFEEKIEEPVFTHVYEENGVLYCASSTSKGVYWYTYCLNNPLIYTDPSGEFFLGTLLTNAVDFLSTLFFKGGLDVTSKESRRSAWRDFDPTASWSKTNKAWNIDLAAFNAGEDANLSQKLGMGIERSLSLLYWGGNVAGHYHNLSGNVESVDRFYEATVLNLKPYSLTNSRAFQLGGYILGHDVGTSIEYFKDKHGNLKLDSDGNPYLTESSSLLIHEYGHYLQSKAYLDDPVAYILMGINSSRHNDQVDDWKSWAERDADFRSLEYFSSMGYSMNDYKWEGANIYKVPYYKVYFYSWAYFVFDIFGID